MSSREPQTSAWRFRSPQNSNHHKRSRSPNFLHHQHPSRNQKRPKPPAPVHLPFQASELHKHDFKTFKPMFKLYLDIQKQKVLEELPDDEVKGRWKSFVGKWYVSTRLCNTRISRYKGLTSVRNRGELAEGWYDPATLQKARSSAASNVVNPGTQSRSRDSPGYGSPRRAEESGDEDFVGPAMPAGETQVSKSDTKLGPTIPNSQDLELQKGIGKPLCAFSTLTISSSV